MWDVQKTCYFDSPILGITSPNPLPFTDVWIAKDCRIPGFQGQRGSGGENLRPVSQWSMPRKSMGIWSKQKLKCLEKWVAILKFGSLGGSRNVMKCQILAVLGGQSFWREAIGGGFEVVIFKDCHLMGLGEFHRDVTRLHPNFSREVGKARGSSQIELVWEAGGWWMVAFSSSRIMVLSVR